MRLNFKNNYLSFFLIFAIASIQFILSICLYQFKVIPDLPFMSPDAQGYIDATNYFLGNELTTEGKYRLFSPIIPFLASLLVPFTGMITSYLIINFLFLFLSLVLIFFYFKMIFGDYRFAYIAAIIFAFSMPVLLFTPSILVEIASWFIVALFFFYSLYPLKHFFLDLILRIFVYVVAVLIKPTLSFIVLFAVVFQFFMRKEYWKAFLSAFFSVVIVLFTYFLFGLNMEDFTKFGGSRHNSIFLVISSFSFAFNFGFIVSLIGILKVKSINFAKKMPENFLMLNFIFLICSLIEFFLFVHATRLIFIIYPVFLVTTVYGIKYLSSKFKFQNFLLIFLTLVIVIFSNLSIYAYYSDFLLDLGKIFIGKNWN